MRRIVFLLLLVTLSTGFSTTSKASPVSLTNFRASGWIVSPGTSGSGDSITGHLAWTPQVDVALFGIRGEIGATLLKDVLGSSFIATNYEVFLLVNLLPMLTVEGGGGLFTLRGAASNTDPILSVNFVIDLIGPLNQLFVGYSRYLVSGSNANIYRAGIGFGF